MIKNNKSFFLILILSVGIISSVSVINFGVDGTRDISISSENKIMPIDNTVSSEHSVPFTASNSYTPPGIGLVRAELSNLPLLNEVITVTVNVTNIYYEQVVQFHLLDGWRFVDVPQEDISIGNYSDRGQHSFINESLTVPFGQSQTFSHKIKPTTLGINYFQVGIPYVEHARFSLFVGENETLPIEQYWDENPRNSEPESDCPNYNTESCPEPKPPRPDQFEENAGRLDIRSITDEEFYKIIEEEGLPFVNETFTNGEITS